MDADGLSVLDSLPIGIFFSATTGDAAAADIPDSIFPFDFTPRSNARSSRHAIAGGGDISSSNKMIHYHRIDALIATLQLSSQLARNSEKYYIMLSRIFVAHKLVWILNQNSSTVRAKCCNLIGNLCRYGILQLIDLIATTYFRLVYYYITSYITK